MFTYARARLFGRGKIQYFGSPRSRKAWIAFTFFLLPSAPLAPAPAVTIKLEGAVLPECQISSSASIIDFGDISKSGTKTLPFSLSCNAPFTYKLLSRSGGLQHKWLNAALTSGFNTILPYTVASTIPIDGGVISDTCSSPSIKADVPTCRFSSSGENIAISSNALLTFSWNPNGKMLESGVYEDFLTIVLDVAGI
jgi:hypothetical protein